MTKSFLVAGSNWVADVQLDDVETLTVEQIKFEAATRAIEGYLGKRTDVEITYHEPIFLTEKQSDGDPLYSHLLGMITEELEEGCGIGRILCIMNPDEEDQSKDVEWYISSKAILENVGVPHLVQRFNEKMTKRD